MLLAGCKPERPAPPEPPAPALHVEFAGCVAVVRGPACELPSNGKLTVWIRTDHDASVALSVDGLPVDGKPRSLQGGAQYGVAVAATARRLSIESKRGVKTTQYVLPLQKRDDIPALEEAEVLRKSGKLDEAAAKLQPLLAGSDPSQRTRARRAYARIQQSKGDTKLALSILNEVLSKDRRIGRISDELQDRFVLAHTYLYAQRRFSDARRVLQEGSVLEREDPAGHVTADYYRGLIAYETGDLRAALELFRASERGAERLGMDAHRAEVLRLEAEILSVLGRHAEASELAREARRLQRTDAPACERVEAPQRPVVRRDGRPQGRAGQSAVGPRTGVVEAR